MLCLMVAGLFSGAMETLKHRFLKAEPQTTGGTGLNTYIKIVDRWVPSSLLKNPLDLLRGKPVIYNIGHL